MAYRCIYPEIHYCSANRGIGLELTKQLLESSSNTIIAASRNPSQATALKALSDSAKGRVHLITLDISNKASVQASVTETEAILKDRGVDYLINNAGIVSHCITPFPETTLTLAPAHTAEPRRVRQRVLDGSRQRSNRVRYERRRARPRRTGVPPACREERREDDRERLEHAGQPRHRLRPALRVVLYL